MKDGELLRKYGYDAFGNRTGLVEGTMEKHYGYNALNQLISEVDSMTERENKKQFRYDKRGNLIEILLNGRLEDQYSYGALNRLEYAKNAAGEEAEYFYNGLGYRVGRQGKKAEKQGAFSETKTKYVIDMTKQYHNLLQKEEAGNWQTFLWDQNAAGMVEEDFLHKFYLQDEMGSPLRLVDAEGNLQESYSYDEFGRDLYPDRMQTQPFGFTGYQADHVAGTYFAQAREYMPSAGRFVSRDADKFISIGNMQSINLYHFCMSSPVRYTDPSGNDLEDQYPLRGNENDAVQVNITGNDITIDVYVDFRGDETLTTANGTPCKDLAIAGIENWSGNYLDVFGEDVTVAVNVHEGDSSIWDSQKYVKLYLKEDNVIPHTNWGIKWSISSNKRIYMPKRDRRVTVPYTDEKYERTVTHEMGHVFGIDDGYADEPSFIRDLAVKAIGITHPIYRPDAAQLDLIDEDDVMRYQFDRLNISSTDIGMFILAYSQDEFQSFDDYTGHKKSEYFNQEAKK